jgi:outer membrane lipoprotein-sorting protein
MIITKKITTIILLITICIPGVYSQDKKAAEILDAFKEQTQSYSTIQVSFTYTMDNASEKIHESFEGMLYIKGENYRLTIAGQLVICDGTTTWTYLEDAQEIQINSVEENDDAITPSRLFTSYYEDFKSKYIGETTRNGVVVQQIELIPIEGKSFSKLVLEISKDKLHPEQFAIYDKGGSTFTYQITEFLPNVAIGNDKFTFNQNAFPDAEIIDMR